MHIGFNDIRNSFELIMDPPLHCLFAAGGRVGSKKLVEECPR